MYCRSSYEVIFTNYLIKNSIDFEYGPKCFKLDNGKRYLPDFYILDENRYVEIKGISYDRMDKSNQQDKFNLFKENNNIEIYLWEDIVNICKLPFKSYSSYRYKAQKMKINIEEYFANMVYLN